MGNKAYLLLLLAILGDVFVTSDALKHRSSYKHRRRHANYEYDQKDYARRSGLKENFYRETCPRAEKIVQEVTRNYVYSNPNLPAKLLRLHYHDCFVRGCDASILLESTPNMRAEKEAKPNSSLEGFEAINNIKAEVEKECKETVSCADILALAARDAVSVQYGRPLWKVLTGRRDGNMSSASEVLVNLPSPFYNFTLLKNMFALKGLSVHDLVTLSGAHTIGVGHCTFFNYRIFNFSGRGDQDPSLNPSYATFLKTICKNQFEYSTTVAMDPGSSFSFDNHYYVALKHHKGLYQSDVALMTNDRAKQFVQELLQPQKFMDEFAISMQKMGAIGVLTKNQGHIRRKCNANN